ncbi:hypothetical protein ACFW5I_03365 [Streptomyces sp. NPDC058818]|uniref:hypothetical protein n=1 Tax=Streptomyces sp. NPDC058818 TaxID=3346640 RepID=UPI0036A40426
MRFLRNIRRAAVAATATLALVGWGSQAAVSAAGQSTGGYEWNLSEEMPQEMREFVTAYYPDGPPRDGATLTRGAIGEPCTGSLQRAVPLPAGVDPSVRKATLFTYWNNSTETSCALMDNNTSGAKYMVLSLCSNTFPAGMDQPCIVDAGNFTYYAGEVKLYATDYATRCDNVYAYMRDSAGKVLVKHNTPLSYCD